MQIISIFVSKFGFIENLIKNSGSDPNLEWWKFPVNRAWVLLLFTLYKMLGYIIMIMASFWLNALMSGTSVCEWLLLYTVCPRSSDPIYIVNSYTNGSLLRGHTVIPTSYRSSTESLRKWSLTKWNKMAVIVKTRYLEGWIWIDFFLFYP